MLSTFCLTSKFKLLFIFVGLYLVLANTSCKKESLEFASTTPVFTDSSSPYNQLPRIPIVELHRWLGFKLIHKEQLQELDLNKKRNKNECGKKWSNFNIKANGWPREGTDTDIKFYTFNGSIEVIFMKPEERFCSEITTEECKGKNTKECYANVKSSCDQAKAKKLREGNLANALNDLDTHIRTCDKIIFNEKEIGYQCPKFAVSHLVMLAQPPLTRPGRIADLDPLEVMLLTFDTPPSPLFPVERLQSAQIGNYGSYLVAYKNEVSLTKFLKDFRQGIDDGPFPENEEFRNCLDDL